MEWDNEFHEEKEFNIRYYHTDPFGRHLYYIEVKQCGKLTEYLLESSLKIDLYTFPRLRKIINVLVNKKTSPATRRLFADEFFNIIPEIFPEITKHYFTSQQLDKFGKYNESWCNTYEYVINNFKLQSYVPLSPYFNEEIFKVLEKAFQAVNNNFDLRVEATKELFEQHLINDQLKFAYIEVYSTEAKYYFQEQWRNDEVLEFYYMTSCKGDLLFWYLVNIRRN